MKSLLLSSDEVEILLLGCYKLLGDVGSEIELEFLQLAVELFESYLTTSGIVESQLLYCYGGSINTSTDDVEVSAPDYQSSPGELFEDYIISLLIVYVDSLGEVATSTRRYWIGFFEFLERATG